MSLDGFIGGPDQSEENPLGVGGTQLLHWQQSKDKADVAALDELLGPMGAFVMGRNMFGPIRGPWSRDWRGWWGDDPPYHAPVFVLTHHEHDPIEMSGGTTFHFVTGGIQVALDRARAARRRQKHPHRRWRIHRAADVHCRPRCPGATARCCCAILMGNLVNLYAPVTDEAKQRFAGR